MGTARWLSVNTTTAAVSQSTGDDGIITVNIIIISIIVIIIIMIIVVLSTSYIFLVDDAGRVFGRWFNGYGHGIEHSYSFATVCWSTLRPLSFF